MKPIITIATPLDRVLTGTIAYIEMDIKDARALIQKVEADRKQAKQQARKERRAQKRQWR